MPHRSTSIRTCPGPGSGSGRSTTSSSAFVQATALIRRAENTMRACLPATAIRTSRTTSPTSPPTARRDVEARIGRSALEAEQIGVSYFRYGPDFSAPIGHRHRVQEEAYVVISGSGRMKIDDEIVDLRQWDVVRVAPEAMRGFQAGPDGLELIAVGGHRPEGGDGEMDRRLVDRGLSLSR